MRKVFAKTCFLAILFSMMIVITSYSAGHTILSLPEDLTIISEEAFMGDVSIEEVSVPKKVLKIEDHAFSDCVGLKKVSIYSRTVQISPEAFSGCPDVTLYVYSGSTSETFAKAKGISYILMDDLDSRPTYLKVKSMIGEFSASGTGLQGGDDRLIVRMNGVSLPDIASYQPVEIIEDDRDTYFIQFASEIEAAECKQMFDRRGDVLFVEYDAVAYVSNRGEDAISVSQAGIMTWEDDDPMGFDIYAPYVESHQAGTQMIAVIDTGVRYNEVYANMLSPMSINMFDDGQDAFYSGRQHATCIAGIIHDCVGKTNVSILSVRAVDDSEQTDSILFGQSIAYAVDSGADIINISYLFPYSSYVEDEIRYAVSKGRKVIISAGNQNGSTSDVFPANANVDDLIVVSGLDDGYQLWSRTNTGKEVTYCAPASGIRTSIGSVGAGTSFAAPMIASAYALVGLDTTHTIRDMRNNCKTDISVGNNTQAIGYGMPLLYKLASIKVSDIIIENIPSVIKVGQTISLPYSVLPEKAMDKIVNATSNNTSVLSVEQGEGESFVLKGQGKGQATVLLTAHDGSGVSRSFNIQVIQPVTSIIISADTYELDLDHTLPLNLRVLPSEADNTKVIWSSSAPDVATVSQTGVVMPVKAGSAVIRADAQDGYGAHYEVTVRVTDTPDPVSIDVSVDDYTFKDDDLLHIEVGEELQLSAKVNPDNAIQTVTWSIKSVPSGAVTVDATGYIKGIKSGTAFITAASTENPLIRREIAVSVEILPTAITIAGKSEINAGETMTLTATVRPDNATNKNVTWSSEDSNIAMVASDGTVYAMANGEVDIVATAEANNAISARKHIIVKQLPMNVSISGTTKLFINNDNPSSPAQNASQLTATVTPSDTYDKSVSWSSSNPNVVTVNSQGLLETVSPGTAVIKVTCNADDTVISSVTVTVKNLWGEWSTWSDTVVTATDDKQVESRTMYKSTTTSYGGWSNWSNYDLTYRVASDTMDVHTAQVYLWNYTPCPHCGKHMWGYGCTCPKWDGGCNNYISSANWQTAYFTASHAEGQQNYGGTGQIRKEFADGVWYANQNDHSPKTGYQYRTRTKNVTQSNWQTTPIAPVNTNDLIVSVDTKTQYRYRNKNSF